MKKVGHIPVFIFVISVGISSFQFMPNCAARTVDATGVSIGNNIQHLQQK